MNRMIILSIVTNPTKNLITFEQLQKKFKHLVIIRELNYLTLQNTNIALQYLEDKLLHHSVIKTTWSRVFW